MRLKYECSVDNCQRATNSLYCATHRATCQFCCRAQELTHEDLVNGACPTCRKWECEDELETLAGAECWCGQHRRAS